MKASKTKKIEEILAQIHPKFLLDHYWNILDLINWRGFVNSEDKEYFTISDLREKITEEINSPSNPFHLRMCLRSKEVIEEVVSELVSTGLLIKEEGKFKKTDTLSNFCYLLKKKFQANLRRYTTWGLWYLDIKPMEVMKKLEPIKDNLIPIEGEFGKETFFERLKEELEKCKSNN